MPTITIQLGVSALPALAAAWVVKNKKATRSTIETVLRVGMLIALPAGIGMASLATPILTILYGRGSSSDAISVIAPIMAAYGFATGIIAISTPTTNMLQAIGRADIPVKSVVVASVCKILCNFILVGNPKLNIYGAVVGTILFYVIIVTCNMALLLRISKVHVRWSSVFLKPFICAALCGVTAYATNGLLNRIFPADTVGNGNDKGSFQLAFLVIICKNSFVDKNGVLIAIADGALIGNSAAIIQNGHLTIMIIHILHIRTDNIIIHLSYVFFNAHFL